MRPGAPLTDVTVAGNSADANAAIWSYNTLTLTESGGRTTVTNQVVYPSKEARDAALTSGMQRGVEASYARLDEHLQTLG